MKATARPIYSIPVPYRYDEIRRFVGMNVQIDKPQRGAKNKTPTGIETYGKGKIIALALYVGHQRKTDAAEPMAVVFEQEDEEIIIISTAQIGHIHQIA